MTITLFPEDRQKIAEALQAVERARFSPTKSNLDAAELALKEATKIVTNYVRVDNGGTMPQAPIEALARKRDARLFQEAMSELTPDERGAYEKKFGFYTTITRLAAEAKKQADVQWESSMQDWVQNQLDEDMRERQKMEIMPNHTVGTNYDLINRLQSQVEAARQNRQGERRQRELAAEVWDNDLSRVVAGLDRDELAKFNRMLETVPSDLQALQQFKAMTGRNPIEAIEDTAKLYDMDLNGTGAPAPAGREPVPPAADWRKTNDSSDLYNIALNDMLGKGR
jgi:hypothetical protein